MPSPQVRGMMWFFSGDKTRLCQFSSLENLARREREIYKQITRNSFDIDSITIPFPVHVIFRTASRRP